MSATPFATARLFVRAHRTSVAIAATAVVAIVIVGSVLIFTKAAGSVISGEVESGTKSIQSVQVTDTSASGGQAVKFSSAVPTGGSCALPKYPTKTCTGVPAGTTLQTVTGDLVVTTAGQVIDGKHVTGSISVQANDVVIKNSQIDGSVVNWNGAGHYRFTIQDSTVGKVGTYNSIWGIGIDNYTATRVLLIWHGDGFRVSGPNILIQDSYVELGNNDPADHSDGIQLYGASANVTIRHNVVDQTKVLSGTATAPLFVPGGPANGNDSAVTTIQDNIFAGGGWTVVLYGGQFPTVTGNKVVNGSWAYGPFDIDCSVIGTWSGNATITYDWTNGAILSQVAARNDC